MTLQHSPLRQRMIEDMVYRNMSVNSQKIYIRAVANFSAFHGRSPDKLTLENVRDYRNHLIGRGLKPTSINPIVGALRFFYGVTLGQREIAVQIPYARKEDTLPEVLAREEVVLLLKAERNLKMRTALITIYATGLRVSEVVALKVSDIDSKRMVINVRRGKGHKGRYVMLSEQLLQILREYWHRTRPAVWLFPGPDPSKPVTTRSIQRSCRRAMQLAGLDKAATVHTLRHSFATHLLEEGVDIRVIQDLLGHRQITSTTRYTRVAVNTICKIQSPLELLDVDALVPG
ncbi:MAG: tyrosine-type recombinase/integrase [Gammaproteobacteria bacterium]|nr:tyrosine-type recombinase/integrase [Gammaproteobacteria bacterium]